MRQVMEHSQEIKQISAALLEVQREIEDPTKNKKNPHFGNTYVDLTALIQAARPILNAHGIVLVQSPEENEQGWVTVETLFLHESGEWLKGRAGSPMQKSDPQGVGSAITYLRRYSLAAMLGLGQEDDDGNAASRRESVSGGAHGIDTSCPLPKHKGKTWREVCAEDPDYIKWCIEKSNLDEADKAMLRKHMESEEPPEGQPTAKEWAWNVWSMVCKENGVTDKAEKLQLLEKYLMAVLGTAAFDEVTDEQWRDLADSMREDGTDLIRQETDLPY